MPFVSRAQERWGVSPAGQRALGGPAAVKEWAGATNQAALPERKDPMAKNWIAGAIKHPGALTRAASEHGRSKLSEAEHEAKSPNKHIAARGRLGERFIKKTV